MRILSMCGFWAVLGFIFCGVVLFCVFLHLKRCNCLSQFSVKIVVSKTCSNSCDRPQGSDQSMSCVLKSCCHKSMYDRLVRSWFGFALHCFKNKYIYIYMYFRTLMSVYFIPCVDSKMVCVVLSFIDKVITKIFSYK